MQKGTPKERVFFALKNCFSVFMLMVFCGAYFLGPSTRERRCLARGVGYRFRKLASCAMFNISAGCTHPMQMLFW